MPPCPGPDGNLHPNCRRVDRSKGVAIPTRRADSGAVPRLKLPSIFIDEHFHPDIKAAYVAAGLRTVAIARDRRYAGRDERDYIEEMYAKNEILVTGDEEFVHWAIENRPRHAGIVWIPQTVRPAEKIFLAEITAVVIRGTVRDGQFAFRGIVLYGAADGVRAVLRNGSNWLVFSWGWFAQLPDAYPIESPRSRPRLLRRRGRLLGTEGRSSQPGGLPALADR